MVTAGASSALTIGTAGCVSVANKCGIRDIPKRYRDLKRRSNYSKRPSYGYDQGLLYCGIQLCRSGNSEKIIRPLSPKHGDGPLYNAAERGQISVKNGFGSRTSTAFPVLMTRPPICRQLQICGITRTWASIWLHSRVEKESAARKTQAAARPGKDLIRGAEPSNNPFDGVGARQEDRERADCGYGSGGRLASEPIG